jgi:hypothetical protein
MAVDNHEINEAEKQFFVDVVEGLDSLLDIHNLLVDEVEPVIAIDETERERDEAVAEQIAIVEKGAVFSLDSLRIAVDTSEIIDDRNERISKAHDVTTTEMLVLDGVKLVTTSSYIVDRYDQEERWEAFFDRDHKIHDPRKGKWIALPDDYEIEAISFWRSPHTDEDVEARRERQAAEMEANDSEQDPEHRFTRSRMWHILPLLQRLGPEHVTERDK